MFSSIISYKNNKLDNGLNINIYKIIFGTLLLFGINTQCRDQCFYVESQVGWITIGSNKCVSSTMCIFPVNTQLIFTNDYFIGIKLTAKLYIFLCWT